MALSNLWSPRSFRSMDSARHLGRPPLPPGEGWGEGNDGGSVQSRQSHRRLNQLKFTENPNPMTLEQRRRHPFATDFDPTERAVIRQQIPARRTVGLEHRHPNAVLLHQFQRSPRPLEKLHADILAIGSDHSSSAIQHLSALPARNLSRRPRRRQSTGHLRTQRHYPPFFDPLLKQIKRPARTTVITHAMAQQAATDQDLFHVQNGSLPRRRNQPVSDRRSRWAGNT